MNILQDFFDHFEEVESNWIEVSQRYVDLEVRHAEAMRLLNLYHIHGDLHYFPPGSPNECLACKFLKQPSAAYEKWQAEVARFQVPLENVLDLATTYDDVRDLPAAIEILLKIQAEAEAALRRMED